MNSSEENILISYLNQGGAIYFEGVNLGYDHNGTNLWNYTGVDYQGQGNLHTGIGDITGASGTFMGEKEINYQVNTYADIHNNRFGAGLGEILFRSGDNHGRVVAYSNGTYRMITSSLIFGGFIDNGGLNTKLNVMKLYTSYLLNNQQAELSLNLEEVDFGVVNPGQETTQTLVLQNTGMQDLEISNLSISNSNFSLSSNENIVLEFGHSVEIEVNFSANEAGEFEGNIMFESNDPDNANITIPVSVSNFTFPSLEYPEELTAVSNNGDGEISFELDNSGQQDLSYWIQVLDANRPDNYGYEWQDSNNSALEFEWVDISTYGTDISFDGTDDYVDLDLPFPFPFYGEIKNEVSISSNGYLTFGTDGIDYSNDEITSPINPNDLIAVFWDDLNGTIGNAYYYYSPEEMSLTIQYSDFAFFNATGDLNFQVKLMYNGDIYFYYDEMDGNLYSSTIGIENANATDGLEVAYNENFLESYMAIKVSYNVDWVILDNWQGLISQDSPETFNLEFPTETLESGEYNAILRVNTNAPDNMIVDIPLSLMVNTTSNSNTDTSPASTVLGQNYPNPFNPETNISFNLANGGDISLAVYDVRGRKVKDLVSGYMDAGNHTLVWNGTNNQNEGVSSGIYFYKIRNGKYSRTRKMVLMK